MRPESQEEESSVLLLLQSGLMKVGFSNCWLRYIKTLISGETAELKGLSWPKRLENRQQKEEFCKLR